MDSLSIPDSEQQRRSSVRCSHIIQSDATINLLFRCYLPHRRLS